MIRIANSLSLRLVASLLAAATLFGAIAGYASYDNALHENDEIFDAQLAQVAQTLLAIGLFADNEHPADPGKLAHKYQNTLYYQLWREDAGELRPLLRSAAEGIEHPFFQNLPEGFSDHVIGATRWRYYRQQNKAQALDVVVGQDDTARTELAREIAWNNIAPFIYGLPLLGLLAIAVVYLGLRPLRHLAEDLRNRSAQDLAPLPESSLPTELRPPVHAMNGLLHELSRAFEHERRFTSDAAHELRTPLAALRAQLDAAVLETESAPDRMEAIRRASLAAQRLQHLVAQLLLLSRLDVSAQLDQSSLQFDELAARACADIAPAAMARNVDLALEAASISIDGNEELLYVMLRNLLDNAVRYTPNGGRIQVRLIGRTGMFRLEVRDSGPGVASEQLQWMGQRFRRFAPTVAEGVGLGLSIVSRIADLHGARVSYANDPEYGGLRVRVNFLHGDGSLMPN